MSDKKVLNEFQMRRQVVQAFQSLVGAANEMVLIDIAHEIVDGYPADLVLNTLVKQLDTDSSQLRGGLGHIATFLPADQTVPALRSAVADRNNSPRMRITASLILERYLGETLPSALTNDLDNSNEVAFQSLREAVESAKANRHILLEYVTQLRQTDVAVAGMVMDMLERIDPMDRVEMLRLIAQDDRPLVATDALQRLELLGKTEAAELAAAALHTLQLVLPKAFAGMAERSLRKLRFTGVMYNPPLPTGWRALMTTADPSGHQTVWLVRHPQTSGESANILGFVLNYRTGVRQMFGSEDLPAEHLPREVDFGETVPIDVGGGRSMTMLEVPFDYGRWLVLHASKPDGQGTELEPLPDEYKLYNDLIWRYARPQIDTVVEVFLTGISLDAGSIELGEDKLGEAKLGEDKLGKDEPVALAEDADHLLSQPAMSAWSRQNLMLAQAVRPLGDKLDDLPTDFIVQQIQREIAKWDEAGVLMEALETSLRAQAAWFYYANDEANAMRAVRLADSIEVIPVAQNPLLTYMIGLGLAQIRKGK